MGAVSRCSAERISTDRKVLFLATSFFVIFQKHGHQCCSRLIDLLDDGEKSVDYDFAMAPRMRSFRRKSLHHMCLH